MESDEQRHRSCLLATEWNVDSDVTDSVRGLRLVAIPSVAVKCLHCRVG